MDATLRYTQLGFGLISLLDKGEVLDFDATHKHLEAGSLFTWLKDQFGDRLALSFYADNDKEAVLELFSSLANVADSRRKFGVERNGLALLAAYCFEALQQMHVR
jgi:hypothetical protein